MRVQSSLNLRVEFIHVRYGLSPVPKFHCPAIVYADSGHLQKPAAPRFTLKTNPLRRSDLEEFVERFRPENRHERKPSWTPKRNPDGRWRAFDYDELIKRDKVNLDIFWLRDESLEDSDNLPPPDEIAAEIVEDLQAALDQFAEIATDLRPEPVTSG